MRVERRKHERKVVGIKVKYSTPESFASDWIMNISKGGMFISTKSPLPPATMLLIEFEVPGREIPVKLSGVVKWISTPEKGIPLIPGMGVEITSISEEDRKVLNEFINRI